MAVAVPAAVVPAEAAAVVVAEAGSAPSACRCCCDAAVALPSAIASARILITRSFIFSILNLN